MKSWIYVALAVVVIVAVVGALFIPNLMLPPVSAEEIKNGVINAMGGIQTIRQEIEVAATMEGQTITVHGVSLIDYVDKEMVVNMTMESPMGETVTRMYYVNQTIYICVEIPPGVPPSWMKVKVSPGDWNNMFVSIDEPLSVMLENSEIKYLSTEKVYGIDCYVISVKPDVEVLMSYLKSIIGPEYSESMTQMGMNLTEALKNLNIKMWVTTQDFLIKKQEITMTLTIMDMDIQITASTLITDYNKPVTITLPPEAYQAPEAPQPLTASF